jgi:hypothetical protein
MNSIASEPQLPRSGNAALAAGALIQASLGAIQLWTQNHSLASRMRK